MKDSYAEYVEEEVKGKVGVPGRSREGHFHRAFALDFGESCWAGDDCLQGRPRPKIGWPKVRAGAALFYSYTVDRGPLGRLGRLGMLHSRQARA